MLRPEDIVVLLDLLTHDDPEMPIHEMAARLHTSPSQVHASLKRAEGAHLLRVSGSGRKAGRKKSVNRSALLELLLHGVRFVYPAERGSETRGVPTSASAPFFSTLASETGLPHVWPDAEGTVRGIAFEPMAKSAPKIARTNEDLYEMLAYVDAIRGGQARERRIAKDRLTRLVKAGR